MSDFPSVDEFQNMLEAIAEEVPEDFFKELESFYLKTAAHLTF